MTGETGSYRYMAPEVFKSELCESTSPLEECPDCKFHASCITV